ncbi:MAG: oligosaccharide flippase family protein [Bacteroidota bacterium]
MNKIPTGNNSLAGKSTRVLSQGLISMIAYGVNFGASFFAVIGIINQLGPSNWGLFSLALQVVAFTSMVADFGIGPVIMRRLAIAPGRAISLLLEATYGRLLLIVPTWLITLGIGLWLKPDFSFFLMLNIMLFNMVISAKLPVLRGTLDAFYRSQSRMGLPTVTMALDSLVLLVAVLVIPLSFRDPVTALLIYTGSNLIGAALLTSMSVSFARRLNTEPVQVSWPGMRELITSSAPLAVYLLLNAFHISIDAIFLKLFHGEEQVGIFTAALRILSPLAVFPTILAISAAPYFARASVAEDDEQRAQMTRLFSVLVKTLLVGSALLAGLGATNARLLVSAVFKPEYADSALPLIILSALFLPMALNIFLVELNNARGHLRNNTRFAAILAGTSLIAGIPLIIFYAAAGAAAAKFIAIAAGLAFLIFHSREGIAVAMKPVIGKTAILFFSLIGVRLLIGSEHWIISNGAALLVVLIELFLLRLYSADELGQWKVHILGLFGKNVRAEGREDVRSPEGATSCSPGRKPGVRETGGSASPSPSPEGALGRVGSSGREDVRAEGREDDNS